MKTGFASVNGRIVSEMTYSVSRGTLNPAMSYCINRKQPAILFHEASVQRILRVWMRSAKIY